MARRLDASFECDCGHQSHFCYNTIWEMEAASRRGRKQHLLDSERDEHTIEFSNGKATAIICPKLGRLVIEG